MKLLAQKAIRMNFGWNERPLSEVDFYSICRHFNVSVTEMPLSTGGFYYRVLGRDFIAIDSRLRGTKRLVVLFHELAHFLFHTPESGATANFHSVGRPTRVEREADAFAICALIPISMIERSSLVEDENFAPELIAERLNLYEKYGI